MNKKWFTLVELIISIAILGIIMFGTTTILLRVIADYNNNQSETLVYNDIKEFLNDSYKIEYNSWLILSWTTKNNSLLLYNDKWWVIIWVFSNTWSNWEKVLSNSEFIYGSNYFWFHKINKINLNNLLSNNLLVENYKFNDWKTYKNLHLNKIKIWKYNDWKIFDINLTILKKFNTKYLWKKNTDISLTEDDSVEFNFNF